MVMLAGSKDQFSLSMISRCWELMRACAGNWHLLSLNKAASPSLVQYMGFLEVQGGEEIGFILIYMIIKAI
jgi:hypothetical protein